MTAKNKSGLSQSRGRMSSSLRSTEFQTQSHPRSHSKMGESLSDLPFSKDKMLYSETSLDKFNLKGISSKNDPVGEANEIKEELARPLKKMKVRRIRKKSKKIVLNPYEAYSFADISKNFNLRSHRLFPDFKF